MIVEVVCWTYAAVCVFVVLADERVEAGTIGRICSTTEILAGFCVLVKTSKETQKH